MPKKELTYDTDAREAILAGVEKLAQAVVSTLGPRGRCAILDKSWGGPLITKDGVTVARDIELSDKAENLGAQIVKQAATKTNDRAGDGTTTATLLAWSIYREALRHLSSGADTQGLITGMRKASAAVTEGLKNKSKKVGGIDGIRAVATIAANGDEKVGKMLADAFAKVGEDGVITVEEGKSLETEVSIVTGMQFDRGLLSPNFATDLETLEAVLDQPLILIHEDKISNVQTLLPLLEASKESNRPLLIIAEDIEGEALAALVVNKLRGILNVCAVKAPGYGDRRKEILQDLAAVTGATPIMKDGLHDLEKATLEMLGSARRVVIDSANTTIVEGTGEQSEIDNRANHIRKQVENTTSDYDREKLEERLARLVGGIGQISVGGATEAEVKERKARIEDSKAATMAALEEGILPGGGTALLKIASKINLDLPEAQAAGANILLRALREPVRVIAENAGMDGSVIARRVLKTRKFAEGYNALDDTYGDLIEMGVVDPTKVTRTALENAVSVAATLMTTDCLVVDAKSDQDDVPAGMESGMGL
ncbi:MAG: chaperonin GroEL [Planctomycetes bacterium]|jgi:chaperonin GroEL|nr:chaperonin GroEL [Planctomycetota bacterium]MBT4028638.1 chaperonin GroEL [Planctomycetota bacterium]MBT4559530.1 chaperonin GroEL [Planctomycetota bacterium]MBT7011600.1 chaperonin GroEL [Planctomycetota bacterium]MBT7318943.1 chaperonin GroEL [Planctomycetota bacterium]